MTLKLASIADRRPPPRRPLAHLFFIPLLPLSLAAVASSVLFWLVNFDVATEGKIGWLHATLGSALSEPQLHFFTALSKDASTVTPLLAVMFSFGLLRASWSYLFRPEGLPRQLAEGRGAYPFPAHYQSTWIQLGLIGTLWSFLLIGARLEFGIDPAESVTILVLAFGTALLSTFSGVLGAYVVGPPVATAVQRVLARAGIRERTTPGLVRQLTEELEALTAGTAAAARTLAVDAGEGDGDAPPTLRRSADETATALGKLRGEVAALDLSAAVERLVGRTVDELVTAVVDRLTTAWDRRLGRLEEALAAEHEALAGGLREGLDRLGGRLEESQRELVEALQSRLGELEDRRGKADAERQEALAAATTRLGDRLEEARERLGESFDRGWRGVGDSLQALPGRFAAELAERIPAAGRPPATELAAPVPWSSPDPGAPTAEGGASPPRDGARAPSWRRFMARLFLDDVH